MTAAYEYFPTESTGEVLQRFPTIELSYETISHKKVSEAHNVAMAIPYGKKYFAWFSFHGPEDVLFLMELNKDKRITKIRWRRHPFGPELSVGTLFYGVFLEETESSSAIFIIEDLLVYRGFPMKNATWGEKLPWIEEFLTKYQGPKMGFYLPAMWGHTPDADLQTIPQKFGKLPYNIHHIQYRSLNEIVPLLNFTPNNGPKTIAKTDTTINPIKPTLPSFTTMRYPQNYTKPQYKMPTIFHVTADIQYDIYHLFAYGPNQSLIYCDVAYIPNYKTSVFMNSLFRNIRENGNLDAIEESDDEEDFQNVAEDKYVDLQKVLFLECRFHFKFKRWIPIRVVSPPCRIVHVSKL